MGGAHNVAMAVLTQQSNQFRQTRAESQTSGSLLSLYSLVSHGGKHHHGRHHFLHKLKHVLGFVGFIATLAFCISFYIKAKTYHDHLEKQRQLEELMNNPNARVASGKKGKKIVDKIIKKTKEIDSADEEAVEAPAESSVDSLIKAAKAKKAIEKKAAPAPAANAY